MYGPSGDQGALAQQNRAQQQMQEGMNTIQQQFAQFTPDFYQKAAKDYTAYAMPQEMNQYRNTGANLSYALARNGLLTSSAATQRESALNEQQQTNLGNIANTAQNQSNELRSNVASQRNQLVSQVEAGAAPSTIGAQASAATSQLRAPTALPPVGNMFSDWANTYLANMQANTYNPATGNIWQMMTMGNYGQPSSAVVG